jgi:hypothetical protein
MSISLHRALVPNIDSGKEAVQANKNAANLKGVRMPSNNARYKTITTPKIAPLINR